MEFHFISNVNLLPWIISMVFLILFLIFKKKGNKNLNRVLVCCFFIGFIIPFLPRQVFGNWDAMKKLHGREINKIELRPSTPGWKVNLTNSEFIIQDKNQIKSICNFLHKSNLYFPQHPNRVWETDMILYARDGESLLLKISKSENNGTSITAPHAELRNDDLDEYLETVTNYIMPQNGDN